MFFGKYMKRACELLLWKVVYIFDLIMGKIRLKNVRIFTNHGCLDEEMLIGSNYLVQLEVKTDLNKSSLSDCLEDTVDYVSLNLIIKEEMLKRSKLIESVAKRIIDRVFDDNKSIKKAKIEISKINPPIEGDVESVSIILKRKEL